MSLNCETISVHVYDRGGQNKLFDLLPLTTLKYTRVRDDISTCNLQVSTEDVDCCADMAKIRSGRHEIVVVRNGVRVWEGPIVRVGYFPDHVEMEAHDVWHYVYRTILRAQYNNAYPNIDFATERIRTMMEGELARKEAQTPPINVLPYLDIRTDEDTAGTSRNTLAYEKTLWEEIDNMAAKSGVDYTCVGRSMVVFDTDFALGRTPQVTDADFAGDIIVTEYGMNLCTYAAVTDGLGNYSAKKVDEGEDPYYGEWEMLETSYQIGETLQCGVVGSNEAAMAEMGEQAVRNLGNRYPTPLVVRVPDNSRLNPDTVLTIADLVPGVRIPLSAGRTCRKVSQEQKLDSVGFEYAKGTEVVTVTMSPAPGVVTIDPDGSEESG